MSSELTAYQRAVAVGLSYGNPGVARMYEGICRSPGGHMTSYGMSSGNASERLIRLERLGLVRTEKDPINKRYRLCYPVPDPAWAEEPHGETEAV